MKIHHDKHHATYVANINKATEGQKPVPILALQESAIEAGVAAVRNNGGGHYNHAFFWQEMAPPDTASKTKPSVQLQTLIDSSFGSLDELKTQFEARAAPGALFGSGWVWICVNQAGDTLKLVGTPNQDNPLMKGAVPGEEVMFPILGLDVWEHAYYLKYQNRYVFFFLFFYCFVLCSHNKLLQLESLLIYTTTVFFFVLLLYMCHSTLIC